MDPMLRILITAAASCILAGIIIHFLLPVLHALKAGQSVRKIGPTWHNNKAGTPLMGGLMFIFSSLLCLLGNLPWMEDYTPFYVFALAFSFGIIGFLDDFCKVKFKRDLGLTAIQKAMLQMAVSAIFVYVTIPVMVFFTAASVALKRYDLALMPAAMIGGLLAYLSLNWHPAKLFMGDTGSLFMGGVVCAMSFALDMPLVLILVGFVYICETLSVILQVTYFKLTHGKRLFKMSPIHHHFEMSGWKEEKIVLTFAAVSALMCILAWFGIAGRIG